MSEGELQPVDSLAVTGEPRDRGPAIVVTAVHLSAEARAALAESLGPGHIVRDIREAGRFADIVLVPAMSGHGVGELRRMFPGATILAGEFADDRYGVDVAGPVRRAMDTGVDGYFLAPDLSGVAQVTRDAVLGKPVGVLATGGAGEARPVLEGSSPAPRRGTVHVVDPAEVRLTADRLDAVALDAAEWIDRLGLRHVDQQRHLIQLLSSLTEELLSRGVDVVCTPTETPPPTDTPDAA